MRHSNQRPPVGGSLLPCLAWIEIEDEFAEGKECCLLYEGVYQAGRNLCERLGEDEDSDVETILNGMERITRLVSLKMYEYGRREVGAVV